MAIYNYVENGVTADVNQTISIDPNGLEELGGPTNQKRYERDDGTFLVIGIGPTTYSRYRIRCHWRNLSVTDANTIESIYHDPAKANKMASSVKLVHPIDGCTYAIKFMEPVLKRTPNHANTIIDLGPILIDIVGHVSGP